MKGLLFHHTVIANQLVLCPMDKVETIIPVGKALITRIGFPPDCCNCFPTASIFNSCFISPRSP